MGGLMLVPPAPDVCQECATPHDADLPHNRDSLSYQMRFHALHGRWPTWADALAHCDGAMRADWTAELTKLGVDLG